MKDTIATGMDIEEPTEELVHEINMNMELKKKKDELMKWFQRHVPGCSAAIQ